MATDDITQRHLSRQRVRGAPSTVPGSAGFVPDYTAQEIRRQTQRSLVCPLEGPLRIESLRTAFAKLESAARAQNLKVTGEPLYVVKADPMIVVPGEREHEACLPVQGEAREDGDVKPSRLEGGYYILSMTGRGLEDVENVYSWLFGKFLPARKHELTRPYILHRVLGGLEVEGDVAIEVQVPAGLSIKPVRTGAGEGAETP